MDAEKRGEMIEILEGFSDQLDGLSFTTTDPVLIWNIRGVEASLIEAVDKLRFCEPEEDASVIKTFLEKISDTSLKKVEKQLTNIFRKFLDEEQLSIIFDDPDEGLTV